MSNRKRILAGLALLLAGTAICYVSGCTSLRRLTFSKQEKIMFASFREQVRESVADPVRAEQLIGVGEDLAFTLHDYSQKLARLTKKCVKANADYDTTPEQLEACYRNLDDCRCKMREAVLAARAQAVSLTTAAEWEALSNRKNSMRDFIKQAPGFF